MTTIHNVIIIGSGPAGLTAGIYTGRSKLKPLIIEGNQPGGQLTTTTAVENWPSFSSVQGPELMENMRAQAITCGAQIISDNVVSVDFSGSTHKVFTESGEQYHAKAIIIATGAQSKKLGCPGEQEFWGKGVTTCATCDAPFYEGKEVVIIGGGNTAMTEAEHLTHFARKVTVIHILDKLTANDPIKDRVLAHPNVTFMYNSTVKRIVGADFRVTGVEVENQITKEVMPLACDGVFITIGLKPATDIFKGQLDIDQYGYIKLSGKTGTSKAGVFAAGDVADYKYKQAITAAGDGCMAALDCEHYLTGQNLTVYSK